MNNSICIILIIIIIIAIVIIKYSRKYQSEHFETLNWNCMKVDKGWIPVNLRKQDPQCLRATNSNDCIITETRERCEQTLKLNDSKNKITCGEELAKKEGTTGYIPGHWCYEIKNKYYQVKPTEWKCYRLGKKEFLPIRENAQRVLECMSKGGKCALSPSKQECLNILNDSKSKIKGCGEHQKFHKASKLMTWCYDNSINRDFLRIPTNDSYAVLYKDCNYKGGSVVLTTGSYNVQPYQSLVIGPKTVLETYSAINTNERTWVVTNKEPYEMVYPCLEFDKLVDYGSIVITPYEEYYTKDKPVVTVYSNCNFSGNKMMINEGAYTKSQLTTFHLLDNQIASIKLAPNTVAEFYTEDFFKGNVLRTVNHSKQENEKYKERHDDCLSPYWSRKIKSVKIKSFSNYFAERKRLVPNVIVYDKCGYEGYYRKLYEGHYTFKDMKQLGILNVMSMKVAPQTVVIFYDNDGFKGEYWRFINSSWKERVEECFIKVDWEDRVKSMKVVAYEDYFQAAQPDVPYAIVYSDCERQEHRWNPKGLVDHGMDVFGVTKWEGKHWIIFSKITVGPHTIVEVYQNENMKDIPKIITNSSKLYENSVCIKGVALKIKSYHQGTKDWISHVDIFSECNYKGNNWRLDIGNYTKQKLTLNKITDIQSIKLGPNTKLIVYAQDNFKGPNQTLTNPLFTDKTGWDCIDKTINIVSLRVVSIKQEEDTVLPYCIFYRECGYNGQGSKLKEGDYSKLNTIYKSVVMGPRTVVELYKNPFYRGRMKRIINSSLKERKDRCFVNDAWDETGSVKVIAYSEFAHTTGRDVIFNPFVKIYRECDLRTLVTTLSKGKYNKVDFDKLKIINIRSIEVGPHTRLTLFGGKFFDGYKWEINNQDDFESIIYKCFDTEYNSLIIESLKTPELQPIYRAYNHDKTNMCINTDISADICGRQKNPQKKGEKIGCIPTYKSGADDVLPLYRAYDPRTDDACIATDERAWCHGSQAWEKIGYILKNEEPNTKPLVYTYKLQGNTMDGINTMHKSDFCFGVGENRECHGVPKPLWLTMGYVYDKNKC